MVLAKNIGEIVLTSEGHLMNHCRLHWKEKAIQCMIML